jgi:hypothetical protein
VEEQKIICFLELCEKGRIKQFGQQDIIHAEYSKGLLEKEIKLDINSVVYICSMNF